MRFVHGWDCANTVAEMLRIRWINDCLNKRKLLKAHKGRRFFGHCIYDGAMISKSSLAFVILVMPVK